MELTIDQALENAVRAHKAGQIEEAEKFYTAILSAQPKHPDANHNLGVLAIGVGQNEQALPLFKTALEANPNIAQFWLSYMDALIRLERSADAKAVLAQAREMGAKGELFDDIEKRLAGGAEDTDLPSKERLLDNAIQLRDDGIFDQAIRLLNEGLAHYPEDADVHSQLSHCYILNDDVGSAQSHLQKAKGIDPANVSASWNEVRLLLKCKKVKDAVALARATNAQLPDDVEGMGILGACLRSNNEVEESLRHLNKAIGLDANYAEAFINRGLINLSQNDKSAALSDLEKAFSLKPYIKPIWDLIVGLKVEAEQYSEAISVLEKMIEIDSGHAKNFAALALCNQKIGNLDAAIDSYKKAISINPEHFEAYNNLGSAQKDRGDLESAIDSYKKALQIKPDFAEACSNLGVALEDKGDIKAALDCYERALQIEPKYIEAHINMGVALQTAGDLQAALECYGRALEIKPDHVVAWMNGAEALDKWNKLEQLELWLGRAANAFETVPAAIRFLEAKLLWRDKKSEEVFQILETIDIESFSEIRKQDYLNLKAKCYEKSKAYNEAYDCFSEMNSIAVRSDDYNRSNPDEYLRDAKEQLGKLRSKELSKISKTETEGLDSASSPVFLVGFPRSGTTLLDTILRSHSSIEVVEEKPMIELAGAYIRKHDNSDIVSQPLSAEIIAGAREVYQTEFSKHLSERKNRSVCIDKLPLNILRIPLIRQLYPQAKFILSMRHPLDSILSCWMQNFRLNSAMAVMTDLDKIVELYCAAMGCLEQCRLDSDLKVHTIRYEDLISDLSGETTALLEFLDLDWEPQMANYRETALKRGRIDTPSYSQVVQPVYSDAKFRWLNYQKHLEKYSEAVQPWIKEFGYGKH